jgi:outer membrane receptor protein involved in Fe transport
LTLAADSAIQAGDTLIWSIGRHNLRFGFQAYRYRQNIFYSGNNGQAGQFTFDGQYTAGPVAGTQAGVVNPLTGLVSGLAEADFLLGLPSQLAGGIQGGTWGQRNSRFAAFAQDDWRIAPQLTLNLGLRWELVTPLNEVNNL